jgi:hypothetical protein
MNKPLNKVVIGVALGGVLGIFDGLTAWFSPEVRAQLAGIVFGSCFKGILTGLAAGFFARKVHNLALGIFIGLLVGMALSYGVAAMQGKYYFEIMLPGSILGAIVGFATQKLPRTA